MDQVGRQLLSPDEVARILNVSLSWVYIHSAPGAKNPLPVKRVGNLLRYDLNEISTWLDNQGTDPRQGEG